MRSFLIEQRKEKGFTQDSLAKEVGVAENYIYMIEKGERTPSVTTAKKIATVLDFDWQLFYEE